MHVAFFRQEMTQHPYEGHCLAAHRGPRRAGNAPVEFKNEYRGEYYVHAHRHQGRIHGLAWIARGSHYIIQSDEDIRHGRAYHYHSHKLSRIRQSLLRGSEQFQNGVKVDIRQGAEHCGMYQAERHHRIHHLGSPHHVALPKKNGADSCAAHCDKRAESYHKVHKRKRNGKAGYGKRPHALANEDAVDYIIQRCCHRRYDSRK